ncbi:hypothetical protein ACNKHS_18355 [Shigella flexneri]
MPAKTPPWSEGQHQARRGGIREIEFIVQVFQLIRGGREPSCNPARCCRR